MGLCVRGRLGSRPHGLCEHERSWEWGLDGGVRGAEDTPLRPAGVLTPKTPKVSAAPAPRDRLCFVVPRQETGRGTGPVPQGAPAVTGPFSGPERTPWGWSWSRVSPHTTPPASRRRQETKAMTESERVFRLISFYLSKREYLVPEVRVDLGLRLPQR